MNSKLTTDQQSTLAPILLLIIALPFAVAGQNIGGGFAAIWLIVIGFRNTDFASIAQLTTKLKIPFIASLGFIITLLVSTFLNDKNSEYEIGRFVFGHLIWILLPVAALRVINGLSTVEVRKIRNSILILGIVVGVFAISQYLIGWRIVGASVVSSPARARGLYSHPLSFAYVVFLLWPFVVDQVLRRPGSYLSWFGALGVFSALVLSESRTVLAIAAAVFAFNVVFKSSGKIRLFLIAAGIVGSGLILVTDNPLARKIHATYSSEGFARSTSYQDDRLVFWHAHYEMVKERPVLGHGIHIQPKYLKTYYEKIGFPEFKKVYPAHNMFLQILADGGIIGLAFFLTWFLWFIVISWRERNSNSYNLVIFQTLVGLAIIAFTQNAFQDSEVRYSITLLVSALVVLNREKILS